MFPALQLRPYAIKQRAHLCGGVPVRGGVAHHERVFRSQGQRRDNAPENFGLGRRRTVDANKVIL